MDTDGMDTRPVHGQLFARLTPAAHPYYAGHYRGEAFPCLRDYSVIIPIDPMVGAHYGAVDRSMTNFARDVSAALAALDASFLSPAVVASDEQRLYNAVVVAARIFQEILTIHPYANGNGHIARYLVWLLLGRFGYWPENWTIDPRPNVTFYSDAISRHRRGDPNHLERLILESIVG